MTFSELLSGSMAKRGLNDRALAKEVGVSHATVACWRNGESLPSTAYGEALCRALAIPTARLLECCAKQKGGV